MARLEARCKTRIPVVIIVKGHDGNLESVTSNLGLGGAFINSSLSLPESTRVRLRAPLPKGELEVEGEILRQEQNGVAVKFLEVGQEEKSALWEYIRENIGQTECPYCGAALRQENAQCRSCGIKTDFAHPEYQDKQHDEETAAWCSMLDMETDRFLDKITGIEGHLESGACEHGLVLKRTSDALYDLTDFSIEFEKAVRNRGLILKKREEFRIKTNHMLSKSYFMNHARIWPRGYQGDYRILDGIYRNTPLSEGIGYYLDYVLLSSALARACRGRLAKAKEILVEGLLTRKGQHLLDIGCGSCRDLFEMAEDIRASDAWVTCLDIDEDALRFSLDRLTYAGLGDRVKFRKYNVVRLINRAKNLREFGKQDIIYSTGVFNYLPAGIVPNLIGALYDLLNPCGKLIIAFEDAERYRIQDYTWPTKWDALIQRTENDCRELFEAAGFPGGALKIKRDETGVIMFCILER